jgi:hypothetical protein
MYIYDYYIIIYDKLFEHEKYYEEFINKKIDKKIEFDKQIISENNINKLPDTKIDNNKLFDYSNDLIKLESKNDLIKLESKNESQNLPKYKTIKESINWIRKIYTKLIFMYHPDKQIDSNDEIFSKIKNDFDKNDFSSLFYYFIKSKNHPYLSKLFNEMMQEKRFIDSLLNLSNYYNFKLNKLMKNTIFKDYLKQNNLFNE